LFILKYNLVGPKATRWSVPEVSSWNTPERLSSISVGPEPVAVNDGASQATPTGGAG
jgi:hypothetical protein